MVLDLRHSFDAAASALRGVARMRALVRSPEIAWRSAPTFRIYLRLRRLGAVAAEINVYLLVVAIGLGVLDLTTLAAFNLPYGLTIFSDDPPEPGQIAAAYEGDATGPNRQPW